MYVRELRVDSQKHAEEDCLQTEITVWVHCYTPDDIDMLIEWLALARQMMIGWTDACTASAARILDKPKKAVPG